MNVTLISRDELLYRLCRDILADVAKQNWVLSVAEPEEAPENSDLYLWDLPPAAIPAKLSKGPATHLFLIGRNDLAALRLRFGAGHSSILLKPVVRSTLAAFLALAITSHENRVSDRTSLRADRDEILQCLIQTNLKLQEYDQDRTAFLARGVHDFRAPLTALSGYCGLLLSEALGPLTKDQREVIQRMLNSTKRLSRMASAMFQLSVGRQVKRLPDLQPGDFQDCLEQALHEITPFADDKCITITVDTDPAPQQLFFEPGQMEQVLINLLHNACKFTPKFGAIQVRATPFFWERRVHSGAVSEDRRRLAVRQANSYRVDVCNTGVPIPQDHLSRIFEEYTSYAGGGDRSGGGLGLAICRMIVEEHDGKIWAENAGAGPRISFVIPMRSEAFRAERQSQMSTVAEASFKHAN